MNREPKHDLSGSTFGYWRVIAFSHMAPGAYWKCRCKCGAEKLVSAGELVRGKTLGCRSCSNRRHGGTKRPEYLIWKAMLGRCNCATDRSYSRYGGRGIRVCDNWLDFACFFADMGPRPSPKHSIDRIDNNGDYEPANCRWATAKQQSRNKKKTIMVTFRGRHRPLADWADDLGLKYTTLSQRLFKLGWSVERALTKPLLERA